MFVVAQQNNYVPIKIFELRERDSLVSTAISRLRTLSSTQMLHVPLYTIIGDRH